MTHATIGTPKQQCVPFRACPSRPNGTNGYKVQVEASAHLSSCVRSPHSTLQDRTPERFFVVLGVLLICDDTSNRLVKDQLESPLRQSRALDVCVRAQLGLETFTLFSSTTSDSQSALTVAWYALKRTCMWLIGASPLSRNSDSVSSS